AQRVRCRLKSAKASTSEIEMIAVACCRLFALAPLGTFWTVQNPSCSTIQRGSFISQAFESTGIGPKTNPFARKVPPLVKNAVPFDESVLDRYVLDSYLLEIQECSGRIRP